MSQDKLSAEQSQPIEQVEDAANPGERVRRYLAGVRREMRLVSWPAWKQVRSTTLVVLFFTFAMAAFFALVNGIAEFLYRLVVGR
jgi:preprotein translocase SecE subunit